MKRIISRIGTLLLALLIMANIPLIAFAAPEIAELSAATPHNTVGNHQIWSISHEIGYRGDYVDVRLRMNQITQQGMCWTMFILDFDTSVLSNPRLSPRIDRNELTPEFQEAYDNLTGVLFETILRPFRGGNAVMHNMIFEGVHSWDPGEVIVSWQSDPNPEAPDNLTSGIFVDIRFDILANAPLGESPVTFSRRPNDVFLAGIGSVSLPIVWESFTDGSVTVLSDVPEIRVVNQQGVLIPTAALTAARRNVTPVVGMEIIPGTGVNAGRFAVDGTTIGDVFTASAPGFQTRSRTLSLADLTASYIEIVLDNYANVAVAVHVMEGAQFVTNATLQHRGNNVTGSGGIFNINVSGQHVGDVLTAAAEGLGYAEHTITFNDLAYPAIIVISLARQNIGLSITNVPGNLTHISQTGTAGVSASAISLAFDGSTNNVVFGSPVALTAGEIEENHYFLGWYRGTAAPAPGTAISTLTGLVTTESHSFNMPATGVQYFALWGARGTVGAYATRVTFNIYGSLRNNPQGTTPPRVPNLLPDGEGGHTTSIVVPVAFGEELCQIAMAPIIAWMDAQESGHAFWGWFTDGALDASGRTRNGFRRPSVGATGFNINQVFTEALFTQLAVDGNINLYAAWALWGDVNDDDVVNGLDVSLVSQYVRRFPGLVIVRPAAHVSRGPAITGLDVSLISQYVRRFPGIVLGQPPSILPGPWSEVLALQTMETVAASASEVLNRFSSFGEATEFGFQGPLTPTAAIPHTVGAHQVWSLSQEIGYRGEYVDVRLRMDQITQHGMCWTMFIVDFDTSVLGNPRLSPRVDRAALTPDMQEAYDTLTGSLRDTVLAPFRGSNAVTHNMIFEGVHMHANTPGEVVVSWQSNPNPEIPDNFTSGIFVDIRFDILANAPIGESAVTFSQRSNDAFLAGVGSIQLDIVWESFTEGSVTVLVDIPEVRILDQQGNVVATSTLAASRGDVTPVQGMTVAPIGVNTGRFSVVGTTVGDVLTASAPGFYDGVHTLTAAEAAALADGRAHYIEITLGSRASALNMIRFWMNDGTGENGRGEIFAIEEVATGRTVFPPYPNPTLQSILELMEPIFTLPAESDEDDDEYNTDDEYYVDDEDAVNEDSDYDVNDDAVVDEDAIGDDESYIADDDAETNSNEDANEDANEDEAVVDGAVTEDEYTYEATYDDGAYLIVTQGSDDLAELLTQMLIMQLSEEEITYTFSGWYTCQTTAPSYRFNFGTLITGELDLYARWERYTPEEIEITHTVLFHRNDGSGNLHYAAFVPQGKILSEYMQMPADPMRPGHTFTGWFTDAQATTQFTDFDGTVEDSFVLFAGWEPTTGATHTVRFFRNDGSDVVHYTATAQSGQPVVRPADPVRFGFIFRGWYLDAGLTQPFDFSTAITSDLNLYARWNVIPPHGGNNWAPSVVVLTEPAVPIAPFADYHNAFIIGFPDGTVRPHSTLTRAEVVTILFRLLDDDFRAQAWSQSNSFADVDAGQWFNNAISTMENTGILNDEALFRPNEAVTRAEFASMVARFFEDVEEAEETQFYDIEDHWAEAYINRIAQFGWAQGVGNGEFNPDAQMTRAEAAAIINRMLERIVGSTNDLLEERTRWPDKTNVNAWYYLYMQEATHSTEFERLTNGTVRWLEILPNLNWTVLERPHSTPGAITIARALQQQQASSTD